MIWGYPADEVLVLVKASDRSVAGAAAELGEKSGSGVDELTQALYPELRRLAQRAMRGERAGHTLQTTSLIHEAYLRLADSPLQALSRAHFLALSARTMRRVLIDHARAQERIKRGGAQLQVSLNEDVAVIEAPGLDLLTIDRLLSQLEQIDRRRAALLEMQLFAGLTYPEMAQATAISEATVHRELRLARAWLQRELQAE
jgi:RNA polymerase sigma factor (TIGR02999 family)